MYNITPMIHWEWERERGQLIRIYDVKKKKRVGMSHSSSVKIHWPFLLISSLHLEFWSDNKLKLFKSVTEKLKDKNNITTKTIGFDTLMGLEVSYFVAKLQ